jgi:hypothetical protein
MKKTMAFVILMLVIAGCTAGGTAEQPLSETNSDETALQPVEESVEETVDNSNLDQETAGQTAGPGGGQSEQTGPVVTSVAPSGSVDLSQLTPEPVGEGEGELIIQPAPGVPDPEAKMVQLASQDLAERLEIDISEVSLIEVIALDWADSSLGCPDPDYAYLMVITPGYQISLEAGGQNYTYHTDQVQNVVLCVNGQPA